MNFTLVHHQNDWNHLNRFLLIGNESGLCLTPERDLRNVSTPALDRCLRSDGVRVVRLAAHVLLSGCSFRTEPAIAAIARALTRGDLRSRRAALDFIPVVLRTGAQLFQFLDYLPPPRSWDGEWRAALGEWYSRRAPLELVGLVLRSPEDTGWRHQEVLSLVRPRARSRGHAAVYQWILHNDLEAMPVDEPAFELICAQRLLKATHSEAVAAAVLKRWPVLCDDVPAAWLDSPWVVREVIKSLPPGNLIRALPRLAGAAGALDALFRTLQINAMTHHPLTPVPVLEALGAVRELSDAGGNVALDDMEMALESLFDDWLRATRMTCGTLVIAIDGAASEAPGTLPLMPGFSPREIFAALTLMASAAAREVYVLRADTELRPVMLGRKESLEGFLEKLGPPAEADRPWDAAAPIQWAQHHGVQADAFLVLNASTFASGPVPLEEALSDYRDRSGMPSKWLGISLGARRMCEDAPRDLNMMEAVGLDASVMALVLALLRDVE